MRCARASARRRRRSPRRIRKGLRRTEGDAAAADRRQETGEGRGRQDDRIKAAAHVSLAKQSPIRPKNRPVWASFRGSASGQLATFAKRKWRQPSGRRESGASFRNKREVPALSVVLICRIVGELSCAGPTVLYASGGHAAQVGQVHQKPRSRSRPRRQGSRTDRAGGSSVRRHQPESAGRSAGGFNASLNAASYACLGEGCA
jgi:hypothetical protein